MTEISEVVQYLVVRSDLRMPKGKGAAQVGHGVLLAVREVERTGIGIEWLKEWEASSYAKIVLQAQNLEELLQLKAEFDTQNLISVMVVDEGRNHVAPKTETVLAVQPMPKHIATKIVGLLSTWR